MHNMLYEQGTLKIIGTLNKVNMYVESKIAFPKLKSLIPWACSRNVETSFHSTNQQRQNILTWIVHPARWYDEAALVYYVS